MQIRIGVALLAAGLVLAAPAGAVSGGKTAKPADVPFIASLPNGCTGTLIAPDRVLTAGHCLDNFSPTNFRVHIGTLHNPGWTGGGIAVRGFAVEPRFKESFPFAHRSPQNAIAQYDVGIVLLAEPVAGVTPVKLGTGGNEKVGDTGSLFGYGLGSSRPRDFSTLLRTGDMTVISASACAKAYPKAIIASEICAQDLKSKHAPLVQACPGDSGGPFLAHTAQGPVQIGITSWGPEVKDAKCGAKPLPGVYMRVSSFASFINDPNPVIEPFPTGDAPYTTVSGVAKVGQTLTCNLPPLGGSPAKVTYRWFFHNKVISRTSTATATRDMVNHSVGCTATARNASGHIEMFSPRIGRLVVRA
jgi:V8-like Glu-specific endopeptidase